MIEVSAGVEKGRGLMKEKVRIGVAVLITAVLFALYMSVLNLFFEARFFYTLPRPPDGALSRCRSFLFKKKKKLSHC